MERCAAFARVVALGIRVDFARYSRNPAPMAPVATSHEIKREAVERHLRMPRQAAQLEQDAQDLEAVAAQWRAAEASRRDPEEIA